MQKDVYTTKEQIAAMQKEILQRKENAAQGRRLRAPNKKRIHNIISWVVFFALFAFLSVTLYGIYEAKSKGETPYLFGAYQLYSVESGSMEPTLTVGSVILTQKAADPERFTSGQIVVFHTLTGATVTHRIIEVIQNENGQIFYRTKGDNPMNSPDQELLTSDRILGIFLAKIPLT